MVILAANQMNEQPLENTFVPQDQDLGHWSSYLKKRLFRAAVPFLHTVGEILIFDISLAIVAHIKLLVLQSITSLYV